jgi:NCS2 family nucleobase:cation symporter-2
MATAATSRYIAFFAGSIFILLAFLPKLAAIFSVIPKPVLGASLIFNASFIIIGGLQIAMSRMMDARKIFVIGISLILGLSIDMVPGVYSQMPQWIQPLFKPSFSFVTLCVLLLNLILKIGNSSTKTMNINLTTYDSSKIFEFMELSGSAWGARRDAIYSAAAGMNEVIEYVRTMDLVDSNVSIEARFDEFNLDVYAHYCGPAIVFRSEAPNAEELMRDDFDFSGLSGHLIKQYADKVKCEVKNGRCTLHMHFDQ